MYYVTASAQEAQNRYTYENFIHFYPPRSLQLVAILLFFSITAIAQYKAPPVLEWGFSSPAISPGFGQKDDWLYKILQTSDGGIVSVGFAARSDSATRFPAIFKYDAMKRTILWENTFPHLPIYAQNDVVGSTLFDVFEFDDGGGNAYFAVGSIYFPNERQRLLVVKVNPVTGQSFAGYPKEIPLNSSNSLSCRGFTMYPIVNSGLHEGYMIAGRIDSLAALIKLNTAADLDTTFANGGFSAFSFTGYNSAVFRNFKPVIDAGVITGYALSGWVGVRLPGTFQQAQDILVMHADAHGDPLWSIIIDKTDLIAAGYSDTTEHQPPIACPDSLQKDRGFDIDIAGNGDFVVSAQVDYCTDIPSGWPYYEYLDYRSALLRIKAENGALLNAFYMKRFRGLDFETPLLLHQDTAFLIGSVYDTPDVKGYIIAFDLETENVLWNKSFHIENGEANNNCIFDFNFASDGGFLVCGNNEINGDDYVIGKLRPDCQSNRSYDIEHGITISTSVVWDTDKDVKGTVRIVNGGKLTIGNGAVIRFADTYALNDYPDIAFGTAQYTKLVVEPGGRLELEDCVLKGVPGCEGTRSMWEGIELWGDPEEAQDLPPGSPQGFMWMNDALIEDAVIGLLLDKKFYNANGHWDAFGAYGGGILFAYNSIFRNCRRSMHFAPYDRRVVNGQNAFYQLNRSNVNSTKFLCDDYMANPHFHDIAYNTRLGVNTHVSMWGVRGVRFSNCQWTSFAALPQALRGSGIVSDDAGYAVFNLGERDNFADLRRGILARYAFDQLKKVTVTGNTFTNVLSSVHIINGTYHQITQDTFRNIPDSFDPDIPAGFGVRLDGSKAYRIAGNQFEAYDAYNAAFGIIADNTLGLPSEILDNYFKDLRIGNQTQRNNKGLQISCNIYEDARYAWSVNPESPQAGSLADQGECDPDKRQAGNRFLDPACPSSGLPQSHIFSSIAFKYRHRPENEETPTCCSNVVDVEDCLLVNSNSETCNFSLPCDPCLEEDLVELMEEAPTDKERWYYLGLLVNLLTEEEEERWDDAAAYIDGEPDESFDKLKVQAWLAAGRYAQAEDALAEIPATDTAFHLLYNLFIALGQEGRSLMQLDTVEENVLWEVAGGKAAEAEIARAALEMIRDTVFYRHFEEIPAQSIEQQVGAPSEQFVGYNTVENFQAFSIVPNPASGEIMLRQLPVREAQNIQVILFNALGNPAKTLSLASGSDHAIISLSGMPAGYYVCVLAIDGQTFRAPFVIIR